MSFPYRCPPAPKLSVFSGLERRTHHRCTDVLGHCAANIIPERYYSGVRGCSGLRKIWSYGFGRFSSKNYYGKPYSNRNFGVFGCRIFKKRKNLGEKIEKIKIGSDNFKLHPWATQSPNMSFQLRLGPKIIAGLIWSRKSDKIWESQPDLSHFQWGSRWKWSRTLVTPQKSRLQISPAIIFGPRGSWKLIFGDCVAQGQSLKWLEAIFIFSIFSPRFFRFLKIWKLENPEISPKHYYGKSYTNHRVPGGDWVRICKKWRHLGPLRRSGGALGGARAPVTQKTIALSIPVT